MMPGENCPVVSNKCTHGNSDDYYIPAGHIVIRVSHRLAPHMNYSPDCMIYNPDHMMIFKYYLKKSQS